MYINEAMKENQTKVDDEIIYAGLHEVRKDSKKFKRKEKYPSRHKYRGVKRRKKGRFG